MRGEETHGVEWKEKKRRRRSEGPEEETQAVTILSHVGHRRPQTGHRILACSE